MGNAAVCVVFIDHGSYGNRIEYKILQDQARNSSGAFVAWHTFGVPRLSYK